jgi:hypothetical protein
MAAGSNPNRKTTRRKKPDPKLWIAEWTIGPTLLPDHVHVSFGLMRPSADGTDRSTTRRFLLHRNHASQLIVELQDALADTGAFGCTEEPVASAPRTLTQQPASNDVRTDTEDDMEAESNHFALGMYGLVGN